MFYIEKNDKPNFIERKLKLLKIKDNTIMFPINENLKENQLEKMALKVKRIIEKKSNSKKVVLSKEIGKEEMFINYLNSYGIEIANGEFLFEILVPDIVQDIITKKKLEENKFVISILINDLTDIEFENIKILAKKYKSINIVTNHVEKFKKLEKSLEEDEGTIISITNNKKRSLMKSGIIINIDFPNELINKYNIKEDAIILNVKLKTKIVNKRFNGLTINDYEIDFRDDKKNDKALENKYYLKNLYESQFYKKQRISDIKEKLKLDNVIIKKLILNNGEL